MGCRWNPIGFHFLTFFFLFTTLHIHPSSSLNSEGFALLKFRARVDSDPHGTLGNWNCDDDNPCLWSGVSCLDGKVQMLDLGGRSLGGTLAAELSQLSELRSLVLHKNHFSGAIPEEFGAFANLQLLDLRNNNFSGKIPSELNKVLSLKHLLLSDNKIEEKFPTELRRFASIHDFQFEENPLGCANRKLGFCIWQSSFGQLSNAEALVLYIKRVFERYPKTLALKMLKSHKQPIHNSPQNFNANFQAHPEINNEEDGSFLRRQLLEEDSINLPAVPSSKKPPVDTIPQSSSHSSGSFPAVPNAEKKKKAAFAPTPNPSESGNDPNQPGGQIAQKSAESEKKSSGLRKIWLHLIIGLAVVTLIAIMAVLIILFQRRAVKSIGPWKTGLSGQLQKAFITGVPKLNRCELETACEDFSNIIESFDGYTVYKGTLSSGVEIAVASTAISSAAEWTRSMEMAYRRKIDTLSRINHKNFVNLIGYCEEDEPFNRMMVFEYAPNGTLFEHLHVEEMEHLDWSSRMRIIMGTAYCLQYMHELNPPIAHSDFSSSNISLTDDYAAKVLEICFSAETGLKPKSVLSSGELEQFVLPIPPEPETNVYNFGVLLLEIISGKLPFSDEEGSIEKWATKFLSDQTTDLEDMVDPSLKSFKQEELEAIIDVIQQCLDEDTRRRPTMKEVTEKLKETINISPDQATPRLSPLWWAELEILSSEAT